MIALSLTAECLSINSKNYLFSKLSFDVKNDVPNEVDFIFIKGDHSLEEIKKNWELFSIKVKKRGTILLHHTSVPSHNASAAKLGSCIYFNRIL